ncbi:hypothetical protein M9H77_26042 [Catharanthus roseus]|uniref:Uncharacterized protein n=1 Tax=Catharanthus roseus TaxID=4058 RepID=A0ACC0A8U7_CATRO|nr:hypothetical protein M9H77_26042 [Catharanthus roseus]
MGQLVGCPPPDPSPLSTSTCPRSTCSCLSRKGGYLRAPFLTPRAPRSGTFSRGRQRDGCTGNVWWISCCDEVQPKVPQIETMHLRIIVCTFFANMVCEGSVGGSCITTEAISSTSCNMEV